jgi:hypothetical protein
VTHVMGEVLIVGAAAVALETTGFQACHAERFCPLALTAWTPSHIVFKFKPQMGDVHESREPQKTISPR